ncbi:MAG: AFG1 family ATPase [Alphaproteobacteria bacterium]|nr:AFG1 family ATPase [Alphaproteobacteria bacterium]
MPDQTPDIATPIAAYRARLAQGLLKADPAQALAAEKLESLHHALVAYRPGQPQGWLARFGIGRPEEPPQGLYLFGPVGRGKSMLMDLFHGAVPVPKRRVHFLAFMQEVHARIHKWQQKAPGEREGKDPIAPLARKIADEATLLCFDEFQITNIADAMILGRLFQALFERGVVIVATSNTEPDRLYEGGLQRELFLPSIALIKQKLDVLDLGSGQDYRRERLKGMQVYYSPLGPAASRALDAAFARMTDDEPGTEMHLVVQGRILVVPKAARGVGRMSFDALCRAALGPADFLALATHLHALVVDGIPVIGADERNAAVRFITLVDALYEHRVTLICAAAAAPDALHPDGPNAAAFRRTASRLFEMQSADYLALEHLT